MEEKRLSSSEKPSSSQPKAEDNDEPFTVRSKSRSRFSFRKDATPVSLPGKSRDIIFSKNKAIEKRFIKMQNISTQLKVLILMSSCLPVFFYYFLMLKIIYMYTVQYSRYLITHYSFILKGITVNICS